MDYKKATGQVYAPNDLLANHLMVLLSQDPWKGENIWRRGSERGCEDGRFRTGPLIWKTTTLLPLTTEAPFQMVPAICSELERPAEMGASQKDEPSGYMRLSQYRAL